MNSSLDRQDNKLFRGIVLLLLAIALVAISFFFTSESVRNRNSVDSTMIKYQLENIQDLVFQKFTYTEKAEMSDTRHLFSFDIPLTTHSIQVLYSGTVKAGYDLSSVFIEVDNRGQTITIRLPDPVITDNYIDQDSIQYIESNNIFNPISSEEVNSFLEELLKDKEAKAIEAGLFVETEKNAKKMITECLSVFEGYTVRFE